MTNEKVYIVRNVFKRLSKWIYKNLCILRGDKNDDNKNKSKAGPDVLVNAILRKLRSMIYEWAMNPVEQPIDTILTTFLRSRITQLVKKVPDKHRFKSLTQLLPSTITIESIIQRIIEPLSRYFRPCMRRYRQQVAEEESKEQSTALRHLLPWKAYMHELLSKDGKSFSLFPLAGHIPAHVRLNETAMIRILTEWRQGRRRNGDDDDDDDDW